MNDANVVEQISESIKRKGSVSLAITSRLEILMPNVNLENGGGRKIDLEDGMNKSFFEIKFAKSVEQGTNF